jgi:hypothetical protein
MQLETSLSDAMQSADALLLVLVPVCSLVIRKKLYWAPRSLIVETRKSFETTESLKFPEIQGNVFPCYNILF